MKTIIISAFPACGKSYAHNDESKEFTSLDSDSSKFSWILDEKGENTGVRDPAFPANYIEHIKSNIGEVDYIFVSSHTDVRQALEDNNLCYAIVQPSPTLKEEWIGRCWLRGSPEAFLKMLDNNWKEWTCPALSILDWSPVGRCFLKSGESIKSKMWFLETLIGNYKEDL